MLIGVKNRGSQYVEDDQLLINKLKLCQNQQVDQLLINIQGGNQQVDQLLINFLREFNLLINS